MNNGRGSDIKSLPDAFTEHDAIQAANVQNSARGVETGVDAVRARQAAGASASNKAFADDSMSSRRA
ncbi:MAG TPA: hypothetical protein VFA39_17270 [Steroidobacteraceae bacterium]|nr:hypothetical protein [Steroidobacteraceae bacterium]